MNKRQIGPYTLLGYSLAGEETVVAVPELNVCFDVGRAPREIISIDNVCLSHGHMDHAAGIAYYLSQRGFVGAPPGRVIVHRAQAQNIQRLMAVWADIEGHHSPGQIEGVLPGQDVQTRRDLVVRPFAVNHPGNSLGFTVVQVRHKLKPEFMGETGPQLVALKKRGVQIEYRVEVPLIAYCGDTALGDFLDKPHVRDAEILLIECTFFDHEHIRRARQGDHIHVSDLREVCGRVRSRRIVLTHLTRRTDIRQARRVLPDAIAAGDVERVSFLMDRPPRRAERTEAVQARTDRD